VKLHVSGLPFGEDTRESKPCGGGERTRTADFYVANGSWLESLSRARNHSPMSEAIVVSHH
jgi:hypothetical protein